jgi:hypothetical protein
METAMELNNNHVQQEKKKRSVYLKDIYVVLALKVHEIVVSTFPVTSTRHDLQHGFTLS